MFNLKNNLMPKVFGLDMSGPIIRVAQSPNKFAFGATIQEAIKKAKIKIKYANIGLPEAECFVRSTPTNSPAIHSNANNQEDNNIKKEIESNIPLNLREIYYDFAKTPQGLFIAAAKQKTVDDYIAQIKKAGLIAWAVEPESMAICRALVQNKESVLIIKISGQESVFIIVSSGIIKFATNGTLEQTSNYLDFYQTEDGQIARILLCGDGDLQKASDFLENSNLSAGKAKLPIEIALNPAYATAIGLALKK